MNQLEIYYAYAKLSQAAYIDLSPMEVNGANPTNKSVIAQVAADQDRVPFSLAGNIFGVANYDPTDYWTMLSPYYKTGESSGHSDPASGFAGMLLSNPTYGKVLAIAGTEPTAGASQFLDDLLFSDLGQIGFLGGALDQLTSLFNYVQELKAPAGATNVLRLEVVQSAGIPTDGSPFIARIGLTQPVYYSLKAHYDGQGQGQLIGANEKLTVTGHSLGGHLAALAVALLPETFTTAYTFNAPGYDPISSALQFKGVDGLLDLFKPYGANPIAADSIANRVVTLESEDAIPGDDNEIVSSSITGTPFSPETYVPTEKVTHDVGHMVESLALQVMLAKLDPSLVEESGNLLNGRFNNILAAESAQPIEAYESLLENLTALIMGTPTALETTGPSDADSVAAGGGDMTIRNAFFEKYFSLMDSPAYQALEGKIQISTTLPAAAEARTDLSAFLSLYHFTPFVLKATDAGALDTLYTAHEAVASLWSDDRNLTAEQRANGEANFTDQYLTDRAKMLGWAKQLNAEDKDYGLIADHDNEWTFSDVGSDYQFTIGSGIPLYQLLADQHRIAFGSDDTLEPDTLTGGDGRDHLYGMTKSAERYDAIERGAA